MTKSARVKFTMEAFVIGTGERVTWICYGQPDYAALKSKKSPVLLYNVQVVGHGKLRE